MTIHLSILLVDNEEFLLDASRQYLDTFLGVKVDCASSATDALRLLQTHTYDAIVSDYDMTEMNGIELLRAIRLEGNDIPFFIFTGKGSEDLVIEAFESGADGYVQKGLALRTHFTTLVQKVSVVVERRRGGRKYTGDDYSGIGQSADIVFHEEPLGIADLTMPGISFEHPVIRTATPDVRTAYLALLQAHAKVYLLDQVTRHDILNALTGILGYMDIIRDINTNPEVSPYYDKIKTLGTLIRTQIAFSRDYQEMGVKPASWQDVASIFHKASSCIKNKAITCTASLSGVQIYADPLIEKIFYTFIENSLRHGEKVSTISCRWYMKGKTMVITYEDDGVGIPAGIKEKIFMKGFGKNSGLGLFLSREIASITNIWIDETGVEGEGVRFGLHIPDKYYRITP